MIEKRILQLETKTAYQEDTVQTLNEIVYQQQKQIDELQATCKRLLDRVSALSANHGNLDAQAHVDEKPPHY